MPNIFEIPLTVGTPQSFLVSLAGVQYRLTLRYRNAIDGGWVLDIASATRVPIIEGIPLVTGADLLAQYKHLGIAGRPWVQTKDNPDAVPTFDNLGDAGKLYFVTD